MKNEAGFRVSVWFPNRDQWVIHALQAKIRAYEDAGLPHSRAEILRAIIKRALEDTLEQQDRSDV